MRGKQVLLSVKIRKIMFKYKFTFVILFLNKLDLITLCVVLIFVLCHGLRLQHFGENYMYASPLERSYHEINNGIPVAVMQN